jgi:uncharacterized protein YndB with AHSA1/START domain
MAERTRGYAHRIDVAAPVDLVWRGLIEPARLKLWFGPEARVTARTGGSYMVKADRDLLREAHIDVFEPGRRMRLIYMPPKLLPAHDAVLVDDFIIGHEGSQVIVHVLGSGFPVEEAWDDYYNRLRGGWAQALARLKVMTERETRAGSLPDKAGGAAPARGTGAPTGGRPLRKP